MGTRLSAACPPPVRCLSASRCGGRAARLWFLGLQPCCPGNNLYNLFGWCLDAA